MTKYYFLLLLTICDSKIQIHIKTSDYLNKTIFKHQGSDIKQVTDKEIQLFNITNDNLNRGIRIEMGKVPDEVFLKDPTVYGDVFKKYKWPDVKRKLSVRNITIVEFIKQDVVLKRNDHINNSTGVVKSKTEMVEPVTNTVAALWEETGLPQDDINFDVNIDFGYEEVCYQATWRNTNTTAFVLAIHKTQGVIEIQPGQSIVSKLLAEKVILLVRIEMHAHLVGNIVANYAHEYGKYHLWSPTIGNIMRAAKLYNGITTKLLLEVRYYTNARLEVVDKDTGKEIVLNKKVQRKRKRKFRFS